METKAENGPTLAPPLRCAVGRTGTTDRRPHHRAPGGAGSGVTEEGTDRSRDYRPA